MRHRHPAPFHTARPAVRESLREGAVGIRARPISFRAGAPVHDDRDRRVLRRIP